MKARDFFILLIVIALGTFAALIVWSLIVKSQLQSATASNSTLNTVSNLVNLL
jgi:uncharacterized membrane protein